MLILPNLIRSKLEIYALVTFLALSAHSNKNLPKLFDQTCIPLIVYNKQLIIEEVKLPTSKHEQGKNNLNPIFSVEFHGR
jgi:hypothetical protein